jgi:integrase
LEEAFAVLSTLLGDREKRAYRLIEGSATITATVDTLSLIDVALSKRPDLARLRSERDGAAQYAKAEKALSYPTINAFGSGGLIPVRDTAHFDDRYAAAGVNMSLPKKRWPAVKFKEKRAITWTEHRAIVAREGNAERKTFYQLAWYLGASQSDLAHLEAGNINWENRVISFAQENRFHCTNAVR